MRIFFVFALLVSSASSQGPPALVSTAHATMKEFAPMVVAVGRTEPSRRARASAEVQARILRVNVDAGSRVDATKVLVELDRKQLLIAEQRAQAELDLASSRLKELEAGARPDELLAARAVLEEAEARLREAKREHDRIKQLVAGGSSSKEELSAAQAAEERATAQRNQRKAELELLEKGAREEVKAQQRAEVAIRAAAFAKAQDDVSRTLVRSPISGIVSARLVDPGHVVAPGATLLEVAVIDPIRIVVPAPERIVGLLRPGVKIPVSFDAHSGKRFTAEVEAVLPEGDRVARTFEIRLRVANPKGALLPGMLARAELPMAAAGKRLAVPRDAVLARPQGSILWIVVGGRAQVVPVKAGYEEGGWIAIEGELSVGAEVIVRGNARIRRGQAVQARKEASHGR